MSGAVRVVFQGECGAFSEDAALHLVGARARLLAKPTFESLFKSVENGQADALILPVENSVAGPIKGAKDLCAKSDLTCVAELRHRVVQNLIGLPGADFACLAFVQSHPAALAQCRRFFRNHPWIKPVDGQDTAGSVREVFRRGDPCWAAIGSRRAAWIYGGKILRSQIEDLQENYTRFVLLARDPKVFPEFAKASRISA